MGIKTICFAGYKKLPNDKLNLVREQLKQQIILAIDEGYTRFIYGDSKKVDIAFAELVAEQKAINEDIILEIDIPYRNLLNYNNKSFQRSLLNCDSVNVITEAYSMNCLMYRNQYMIRDSDKLIVLYDGREKSKMAFAMRYAASLGREIHTIWV